MEANMSDKEKRMSDAFQVFMREAPKHAQAWMAAVQDLANASVLDKKTESLAYFAVLSALRLESGIPSMTTVTISFPDLDYLLRDALSFSQVEPKVSLLWF
jgi:alkylhydroperoxidase/carboxymuconolactone decarboxylase family protein YurZ